MAEQYSSKVMEHFLHPHNVGELEDPSGVGEVGNPQCGDIMKMYIKVDHNIIIDAKFKTFGCGAAIATSSMTTELIKGQTIDDALKLTNQAVAKALGGLPKIKMHCSALAEQALQGAIDDHLKKTTEVLVASQAPAGFWNQYWATGTPPQPGDALEQDIIDDRGRCMVATGHVLEWWAFAPEDVLPPPEVTETAPEEAAAE